METGCRTVTACNWHLSESNPYLKNYTLLFILLGSNFFNTFPKRSPSAFQVNRPFKQAQMGLLGTNVASLKFRWEVRLTPKGDTGMKSCETLEKMLKMSSGDRQRAGRIVARSFYKTLRKNGFSQAEIMDVAGHILDDLIKDMKTSGKDRESPVEIQDLNVRSQSKEVA